MRRERMSALDRLLRTPHPDDRPRYQAGHTYEGVEILEGRDGPIYLITFNGPCGYTKPTVGPSMGPKAV